MKQPPAAAGSTRKKDSSSSSEESDSEEEQTAKAPAQSKSILSNLFKLRLGKNLGLFNLLYAFLNNRTQGWCSHNTQSSCCCQRCSSKEEGEQQQRRQLLRFWRWEASQGTHKAFFMLCVVDCLTLSQVWCVADKCMQQILTAYFHVFCQAPVKPAPVKPAPVNKAGAESSSEDSSSEDEAPPSKKPKAGVFSCFLTTIQATQ